MAAQGLGAVPTTSPGLDSSAYTACRLTCNRALKSAAVIPSASRTARIQPARGGVSVWGANPAQAPVLGLAPALSQ